MPEKRLVSVWLWLHVFFKYTTKHSTCLPPRNANNSNRMVYRCVSSPLPNVLCVVFLQLKELDPQLVMECCTLVKVSRAAVLAVPCRTRFQLIRHTLTCRIFLTKGVEFRAVPTTISSYFHLSTANRARPSGSDSPRHRWYFQLPRCRR